MHSLCPGPGLIETSGMRGETMSKTMISSTYYPYCQLSTLPSTLRGLFPLFPRLFLFAYSWKEIEITNNPIARTDWLMSPLGESVSLTHERYPWATSPVVLGERPFLDGGHSSRIQCSMGGGKESRGGSDLGGSLSTFLDLHQMAAV